MPADRLFEIEPSGASPVATNVGPTGVLAMLLIEYAVAASNDWYQFPLTLPYGTVFHVTNLTVSDTFGVETTVGPASADRDAWSMFEVNAGRFGERRAPLFLFPAASARTMDGDPIEEVAIFRDDRAALPRLLDLGIEVGEMRPRLGRQVGGPGEEEGDDLPLRIDACIIVAARGDDAPADKYDRRLRRIIRPVGIAHRQIVFAEDEIDRRRALARYSHATFFGGVADQRHFLKIAAAITRRAQPRRIELRGDILGGGGYQAL